MKNICVLFISLLVCFGSCRISKPASQNRTAGKEAMKPVAEEAPVKTDFSKQITWILGYFNPAQLTREPYSEWYTKGFDNYQPGTEAINKLLDIKKEGLTIKVVMGTWCPDSRREVPRFMRVLSIWQFPLTSVTFIGVDDSKLSPVGEYVNLDIQRVPTFIFYKNNIEAGRIIENPTASLEQDMVNILIRNEKQ